MKKIAMLMFAVVAMASCTKVIDIDLNSITSKVVIEGLVTDQNDPFSVRITKTVNFSDANDYPPVSKATVTIADNTGKTEVLTETTAGLYRTKNMVGVSGRTYTLTVNAEGKTYTAKSTMPTKVPLLDIKTEVLKRPGATKDTYIIFPQYVDPKGTGNSYRFIQGTSAKMDKTVVVTNDNNQDGLPNQRPIVSREFDIFLGDTVTVQMHCIDKVTYDYYYSLTQSSRNGPGGGATPANPITNIEGGALGYFAAFTVQKLTKVIK